MTSPLTTAALRLVAVALAASSAATAGELISGNALAGAARTTVLAEIDHNGTQCRPERTVEAWLRDLTGRAARSITWTGGRCRLARKESPTDSGGRWCGQATIRYARPLDATDEATIEIYFEDPKSGHPGKAYAFRGVMRGADGWEYVRWSSEFEALWRSRFPSEADRACRDGGDTERPE